MFIFPIALDEEAMDGAVKRVQEEIDRLGGKVSATELLGRRNFARQMKKKDAGFYVRMEMDFPPERVADLLARLKLNEDVFRVQIIRKDETHASADAPEPVAAAPAEEE
jgi:ribosomal protein S6